MKRLTTLEKCWLALGLVFLASGVFVLFHPTEIVLFHAGPYKYKGIMGANPPERVSKTGSRIYGGAAGLIGGAMIYLAFYRGGDKQ